MKERILKYYKDNQLETICLAVLLIVLTVRFIYQTNDLKDNGYVVDGVIVECQNLNLNGACYVKVEFYTREGVKRTCKNTLYYKENCALGKKVKLKYSTKTDLTDVLEVDM